MSNCSCSFWRGWFETLDVKFLHYAESVRVDLFDADFHQIGYGFRQETVHKIAVDRPCPVLVTSMGFVRISTTNWTITPAPSD